LQVIKYDKLIRDKVINYTQNGHRAVTRQIEGQEKQHHLKIKLLEEVTEYLKDSDLIELADILEVVFALAEGEGINQDDLMQIRENKLEERGGFDNGTFLECLVTGEDSDKLIADVKQKRDVAAKNTICKHCQAGVEFADELLKEWGEK
jgi:predicted house-cleaning noncanonical NTP pyrophosphatase (MazG superfamily)